MVVIVKCINYIKVILFFHIFMTSYLSIKLLVNITRFVYVSDKA